MKLTILLLFIFISFFGYTQTQQNKVGSLGNLTSNIPTTISASGDTLYSIRFSINLVDTINMNKIKVKVGNTFQGNELFEGDYYVYGTSTSNAAFTRNGLELIGDIGNFEQGVYFYQITVEDFQGVAYTPFIRQQ